MAIIHIDEYLILPELKPYRKFLREKRYSSSDLGVAYRVINHWAEIGLIIDDRPNTKAPSKWRKFSIVDIVWVYVIKELRKYGFGLDKLLELRASLFNYAGDIKTPSFDLEFRIFLTMSKTSVNLLIYDDGLGLFTSTSQQSSEKFIKGYLGKELNKSSFILVDLNKIASKVLSKSNLPDFNNVIDLSLDELELIKFIRSNDFNEVRIVLSDGKLLRYEGKQMVGHESDLLDIIKQHQYQKIEVLVTGDKVARIIKTVQKKPNN